VLAEGFCVDSMLSWLLCCIYTTFFNLNDFCSQGVSAVLLT
jgi:hypothetical protein